MQKTVTNITWYDFGLIAKRGFNTIGLYYTYDPYGKQLTSSGSTQNKIKYSNGYQDITTGLYKYGARYYNPDEARWTQTDPSGQDAHYVYAGNSPVNFSDPSGYFSLTTAISSAYDLGTTGAEVGAIGGCAGGAISSLLLVSPELAPALCGIGAGGGAIQGALILGISGFIVGGIQETNVNNPLSH